MEAFPLDPFEADAIADVGGLDLFERVRNRSLGFRVEGDAIRAFLLRAGAERREWGIGNRD